MCTVLLVSLYIYIAINPVLFILKLVTGTYSHINIHIESITLSHAIGLLGETTEVAGNPNENGVPTDDVSEEEMEKYMVEGLYVPLA